GGAKGGGGGKEHSRGVSRFEPLLLCRSQSLRHAADRDRERAGSAQLRRSARLPDRTEAGVAVRRGIHLRYGERSPALRRQRVGAVEGRGEVRDTGGSEEPEFISLCQDGN